MNNNAEEVPAVAEEKKEEEVTCDEESDRKAKLEILIQHLEPLCNDDAEHEQLRKIGKALRYGDKLTGKALSGGYTNFSYKVFLESDPSVAVFAKVGFTFAIWAPDRSVFYDLDRMATEYECMQRFSKELGEEDPCVPTPFALINISKDIRALVAEWVAPSDEQWAHQFIEGEVDDRPLMKCAQALARVNLAQCPNPDINKGFNDCFKEICDGTDELYLELLESPASDDRAVEYAKLMGHDRLLAALKGWHDADNSQECFVHGDAHVFNMMVERKPDACNLENFGPNGKLYICDWEMVNKGDKGNDVGRFFSFPILAAGFLASRGHGASADGLLDTMRQFWEEYKRVMVAEGNNSEKELASILLSAIGYCGWFSSFVYYLCKYFLDYHNKDGLTENEVEQVMASNGLIALKSMEMCYLEHSKHALLDLEDLEELFFSGLIKQELLHLENTIGAASMNRKAARRRSSLLRCSERRASDTGFGMVVRRLSSDFYDIEELP
ncbi:MAG: hypothetical protein SGARI_001677 [Bacillariaceae sp.]